MATEQIVKREESEVVGSSDDSNEHIKQASPQLKSSSSSTSTSKSKNRDKDASGSAKRRCVSTACIACRRRKSKCDGNTPSCAACASVYGTQCIYDPNSDHRRKGVYKKDIDNLKTRNSTLQTLVHAILNSPEDDVPTLVQQMRTCESLDDVAENLIAKENGLELDEEELELPMFARNSVGNAPTLESELLGKMGELRLENGSVKYIGGTSNLIQLDGASGTSRDAADLITESQQSWDEAPITSWTTVTDDVELFLHLMKMYFNWHYPYFTTLSKSLFYRDYSLGKPSEDGRQESEYCSSLLVNAMLALGCHFTNWPGARSDPADSATAGDHFFREAKRLVMTDDAHEKPRLATVQALSLMSVREAGCGREGRGWVYSGMSFRMAVELGLNVDSGSTAHRASKLDDEGIDARRITFWGCFLFDKCWSNYLGRQPQLQANNTTVPKFEVFPFEDSALWSPYTDAGILQAHSQPGRTRAVALFISSLCEISSDLLIYFYHPTHLEKPGSRTTELKKLSELHTRLEGWRTSLPKELEPREGALPPVILMHMFFQLLFIHLYRPFLRYNQATSPLPAHVSPRKLCTQAAGCISKLLRIYKRTYGLRQICNVAVYIVHSACTIHLLNLPEKTARRDIIHGVKHLEEIAEGWLCARRTLGILGVLTKRWSIELPEEAAAVLARAEAKFGPHAGEEASSPDSERSDPSSPPPVPQSTGCTSTHTAQPSPRASQTSTNMPNMNPMMSPTGPLTSAQVRRPSQAISNPPNLGSRSVTGPPRYVSATTMPAAYRPSWNAVEPTVNTHTPAAQLFVNVNAAVPVQESQDWWMEDQSSLASDFGNWTGTDSDPAMMAETFQEMNGSLNAQTFTFDTSALLNGTGNDNGNGNGGIIQGGADALNGDWYG